MRIKFDTLVVEDQELRAEYIDMLKKNSENVKVYICGYCLNREIVVHSKNKDKQKSFLAVNTVTYDRQCPACTNFMSEGFEVDLTQARNYFTNKEVV